MVCLRGDCPKTGWAGLVVERRAIVEAWRKLTEIVNSQKEKHYTVSLSIQF